MPSRLLIDSPTASKTDSGLQRSKDLKGGGGWFDVRGPRTGVDVLSWQLPMVHRPAAALGGAPWGGAEMGEIHRIGLRLNDRVGDDQAWYEEWTGMAAHLERQGRAHPHPPR